MSEENTDIIEGTIAELNRLRTDNKTYSKELKTYKEDFENFFPNEKDTITEIGKVQKKLESTKCPEIQQDKTLTKIAEDLFSELSNSSTTKYYPFDQEYLDSILSVSIDGIKISKNYVCTDNNPKDLVLSILFNKEDISEQNHPIINPQVKFVGIASDELKGKVVTLLIFTDSVDPPKETPVESSLLDKINILRANPKAFTKLFENNKKKSKVVENLENMKRVGELTENPILTEAATKRAEEYDNDKKPKDFNELDEFLENYGKNYFNIAEYIGENKGSSDEFINDALLNDEDLSKLLLSRQFKEIGYAVSKGGNVVILLADNIEKKTDEKEGIVIPNIMKKISRPEFTEDEDSQIVNDFKRFDILNNGTLKPSNILVFAEKDPEFAKENPLYYNALKNLNTEENNKDGVTVDQFKDAVKKAIRDYDANLEKWKEVFDLYFGKGNKGDKIDVTILKNVMKDLGYEFEDADIDKIFAKLNGDINFEIFQKIMGFTDLKYARNIITKI